MSWLLYYQQERERWPGLTGENGRCGFDEADIALRRMAKHFEVALYKIEATSGNRHSCASRTRITLNTDHLSWLVVVHEFAHCWEMQRRTDSRKYRAHCKRHARLVDRGSRYVLRQGWPQGSIACGLAWQAHRQENKKHVAAQPPSTDARIEHRQAQVKRLERRIKMLNTRLKKAKRSLAALQRNAMKNNGGTK